MTASGGSTADHSIERQVYPQAHPGRPPGDDRRFALGLALVAFAALAWRVLYTWSTHGHDTELFDEGDAFLYSAVATNSAAGHWYVNPFNGSHFADHPPLTVAVLTPTSWLFHQSVLAQRLTMVVLGVAAVVAIGLLARSVAGDAAGLAAAVVAAAAPNLWMNDAVIMSESLSTLLIALLLWAVVGLWRRPSLGRALGTGALCGLTVLARAEVGLFLPLMIAPVLLMARSLTWPRRLGAIALAGVATLAVVAPWTLWSSSKFADPVLLSTNDGTTLLGANCAETYRSAIVGGWSLKCVLDLDVEGLDASQASAEQRSEAVSNITDELGRLPVVLVAREGRTFGFWRPDQQVYANQGEGRPRWASWAGYGSFWLLIVPSAWGLVVLRRRRVTLVPFVATAVTVVAVSALFYGIPRFRLPLDVAMCALAGVAVASWLGRVPPAEMGDEAPAPLSAGGAGDDPGA